MPKVKVSLSIGLARCRQSDIIDIDEDEWSDCETEQDRQDLIDAYAKEWASTYLDIWAELVE